MRIQETEEYRLVKQLTAKENRTAIKKALWQVPAAMFTVYAGMWGFMYFILWIWNL